MSPFTEEHTNSLPDDQLIKRIGKENFNKLKMIASQDKISFSHIKYMLTQAISEDEPFVQKGLLSKDDVDDYFNFDVI